MRWRSGRGSSCGGSRGPPSESRPVNRRLKEYGLRSCGPDRMRARSWSSPLCSRTARDRSKLGRLQLCIAGLARVQCRVNIPRTHWRRGATCANRLLTQVRRSEPTGRSIEGVASWSRGIHGFHGRPRLVGPQCQRLRRGAGPGRASQQLPSVDSGGLFHRMVASRDDVVDNLVRVNSGSSWTSIEENSPKSGPATSRKPCMAMPKPCVSISAVTRTPRRQRWWMLGGRRS